MASNKTDISALPDEVQRQLSQAMDEKLIALGLAPANPPAELSPVEKVDAALASVASAIESEKAIAHVDVVERAIYAALVSMYALIKPVDSTSEGE